MRERFERWLRQKAMTFIVSPILETLVRIERNQNNMALDLSALNAAVAAIADDVTAVKTVIADLKKLVQDLKDQLAAGTLDQGQIDAAVAKLTQADADLDAAVAPETPPIS